MSALLAFVLLELMAVIGGVAVFLSPVMDVDLPSFATSEEWLPKPLFPISGVPARFCAFRFP